MIIRAMHIEDCDAVVAIHMRSFDGFFLSFLGPKFLNLLYYSFIKDPYCITFIAECGGFIVGFVAGSTQPSTFYARLLKNKLLCFLEASLRGFIQKPAILSRLLRAFTMPRQPLPTKKCSLLMSMAVEPNFQSKGIGKILATAFLDEAKKRGADSVYLTTDSIDNDHANHFYQTLGFSINRVYVTNETRKMNEYIIKFN